MVSNLVDRITSIQTVVEGLGFPSLRPHQVIPVQNTLAEKDQFVVMPTGGGKIYLPFT